MALLILLFGLSLGELLAIYLSKHICLSKLPIRLFH